MPTGTTAATVVSTLGPSPRVFPIPLYDPDVLRRAAKQNGRNADLRVANWLGFFVESRRRQRSLRPHHADPRRDRRQRRPGARRACSRSAIRLVNSTWRVSSASILTTTTHSRRRSAALLRTGPVAGQRRRRSVARDGRRPIWSSSTAADDAARGDGEHRAPARGLGDVGHLRRRATTPNPDLILQAMRAGANEFFTWPPADEAFSRGDPPRPRRGANRRRARGQTATTLVFFGAKGGAGTTTLAVNCGVELARLASARRSSST